MTSASSSSLGFDHVRLSINPEPLIAENTGLPEHRVVTLNPDALARLDKSIADITATGLNVILDIHPDPPYVETLSQGDQGVASFLAFWKVFATHYACTDPTKVYFELLNEPPTADNARWSSIQARAVALIRPIVPHHTLIATGAAVGRHPRPPRHSSPSKTTTSSTASTTTTPWSSPTREPAGPAPASSTSATCPTLPRPRPSPLS